MTRCTILFATDFGELSPGGILNFLRGLGAHHPELFRITYVGMGPQAGPLPSKNSKYIGLGKAARHGERAGINAKYLLRLIQGRREIFKGSDVVICHRAEHCLAIPFKTSLILLLHGGSWGLWKSQKSIMGLIYPLIELFAGLRAEKVFSVAPETHTWLFKRLVNVEFLPPPYNDKIFTAAKNKPQAHPNNNVKLVAAARLVSEKRLHLILELASKIEGASVHIFGDGPAKAQLESLAMRLQVNATFHGMAAPSEIGRWYREHACIFVCCSKFEGFPIAVLEAAASGVPIVALDEPGVASSAKSLGGYVAKNKNELLKKVHEAVAGGPRRTSSDISGEFGQSSVANKFWDKVHVN